MARDYLTDEQVEIEIDRLIHSDAVRLAKKEVRIRLKRLQYMSSLRCLEKRGKELEAQGVTLDNIDEMFDSGDCP